MNGSQMAINVCLCYVNYGILEVISDDSSHDMFKELAERIIKSYHLASNGLAERAIQVLRNGMKVFSKDNIFTQLAIFLITYHKFLQQKS